ncbi:MAG: DsbE family thiol:disulfide interchange protein [Pseudomonadota bacterium]
MKRSFTLTLLPIIFFAALAAIFFLRIKAGDPAILPSALIGKIIPDFTLPALPKSNLPGFSSTDLKQNRMTLVNVWASWCGPCRAEHPVLMMLAEQAKKGEFEVFGMNYKDRPQAALDFIADQGNPYSRIGMDDSGRTGIDWGVYGVPETFIVDGSGKIVFKHVGPLNDEALEKILPFLKAAR